MLIDVLTVVSLSTRNLSASQPSHVLLAHTDSAVGVVSFNDLYSFDTQTHAWSMVSYAEGCPVPPKRCESGKRAFPRCRPSADVAACTIACATTVGDENPD